MEVFKSKHPKHQIACTPGPLQLKKRRSSFKPLVLEEMPLENMNEKMHLRKRNSLGSLPTTVDLVPRKQHLPSKPLPLFRTPKRSASKKKFPRKLSMSKMLELAGNQPNPSKGQGLFPSPSNVGKVQNQSPKKLKQAAPAAVKSIVTHSKMPQMEQSLSDSMIDQNNDLLYKYHLQQTFQSLSMLRNMSTISLADIESRKKFLPRRAGFEDKKTVIFDLDETLVHCFEHFNQNAHAILPIVMPTGEAINISINVRPFARECLKKTSKHFEVIVFTASHQCYADVVLDFLDPNHEMIHHRLYRNDCIVHDGFHIKDLRIFADRDLKDIVIVDNAIYSFYYQLENGIPIISWIDNKYDEELYNLCNYLKILSRVDDIRVINRETFHLETFFEDYIAQMIEDK